MTEASQTEILAVTIPPGDPNGGRLDKVLADCLTALSRARLKALILARRVAVDGRTIEDPSHRVKPGAEVTVTVPPPEPAVPRPQAIPLDVVFEDDAVIVVNKPAGLTVHPGAGTPDGTLVNALLAHCGDRLSGIGGVARPGIVHRLDKDTSGLMVVAKSDAAHRGLAAQFAAHDGAGRRLSRSYRAIVDGLPHPTQGLIDAPIGRHPVDRVRMAVVDRGKPARTHYRVVELLGPPGTAALVDCRLETGRTHQIRVHMAHIGHPLIGDPLYSSVSKHKARCSDWRRFGRQALHAGRLGFEHPGRGEPMVFDIPLPADMEALVATLKAVRPAV